MHQSRDAIREKFGGYEQFGTFCFIHCNCLDTARPGGGPADEGSDAARWHPLIQRAVGSLSTALSIKQWTMHLE